VRAPSPLLPLRHGYAIGYARGYAKLWSMPALHNLPTPTCRVGYALLLWQVGGYAGRLCTYPSSTPPRGVLLETAHAHEHTPRTYTSPLSLAASPSAPLALRVVEYCMHESETDCETRDVPSVGAPTWTTADFLVICAPAGFCASAPPIAGPAPLAHAERGHGRARARASAGGAGTTRHGATGGSRCL